MNTHWQKTTDGISYVLECDGPNAACRKAYRAGRSVHVAIHGADEHYVTTQGRLVMPTYHYATLDEGIDAVRHARSSAVTPATDAEWLRLEAEHRVPFRTIPGLNHPTRR